MLHRCYIVVSSMKRPTSDDDIDESSMSSMCSRLGHINSTLQAWHQIKHEIRPVPHEFNQTSFSSLDLTFEPT